MLTNLDFLKPGAQWPPPSEHERMKMYRNNRALFEGGHADVYLEALKRIERVIGNFEQVISYPVVLGFQKIMSLKIADFLLGEPPQITAGKKDSPEQLAIDTILKTSGEFGLICTLYESAIDVSRFGDGLLMTRFDGQRGVIEPSQPLIWYPVVNPLNVKNVLYHVLANCVDVDDKTKQLHVQIHSRGSVEERMYLVDGGVIQRLVNTPTITQTGIDDFAVVQIPNVITSDRATGIDDYTDIDSIISELLVRVGQIARILDKHADPSMTGPATALEQDPVTGQYRLKLGNFFPRESTDEPPMEYVVWDGQLDANFKAVEKLVNFLYTISEMGSAVFGDLSTSTGQVPSGSALRRLMISPLAKVNRIRMRMDPAVKKALVLCSQLGGPDIVDLSKADISITWQDGLPGDPLEESTIISNRTGGKATMSIQRVLKQYDGMSEDDADAELARIQDEEAASTPLTLPGFMQTDNSGATGGGQTEQPGVAPAQEVQQ